MKAPIRALRLVGAIALVALLGACAHPLSLDAGKTPARVEANLVAKKVGYVMTDADRAKQVTTPGGGGDKVSYFPYRDLEKSLREALRSVYTDVTSLPNGTAASAAGAVLVFTPVITTTSSSPSPFTWPPTRFSTEIACTVTDAAGAPVAKFTVMGNGAAEFDEFKSDFSLSAKRSVIEVAEKFAQAVRAEPKLTQAGAGMAPVAQASPVMSSPMAVASMPVAPTPVAQAAPVAAVAPVAPVAPAPMAAAPVTQPAPMAPARPLAAASPAPVAPVAMVATSTVAPNVAARASRPVVGQDSFNAERVARAESCAALPRAELVEKGPGFETYNVPCTNGSPIAVRCEFGNCRVQK